MRRRQLPRVDADTGPGVALVLAEECPGHQHMLGKGGSDDIFPIWFQRPCRGLFRIRLCGSTCPDDLQNVVRTGFDGQAMRRDDLIQYCARTSPAVGRSRASLSRRLLN